MANEIKYYVGTEALQALKDNIDNKIESVRSFKITLTDDGDNVVADKSFSEIFAAYNDGRTVYITYNNRIIPLTLIRDNGAVFETDCELIYERIMCMNQGETDMWTYSLEPTVASAHSYGGVKAEPKTDDYTVPVQIGENGFLYVPAAEQVQADWSVNDPTSPAYIQNRPFHETDTVEVEILNVENLQTFYYGFTYHDPVQSITMPVIGNVYRVIFDGVEYNAQCTGEFVSSNAVCIIGYEHMYDDTTVCPTIEFAEDGSAHIWTKDTVDATHSVRIIGYHSNVIQLDEKYIAYKPGKIVSGQTFVIDGKEVVAGRNAEIFNDYYYNVATGMYSHAEGLGNIASGDCSHAEGSNTIASGDYAHAEGSYTTASHFNTHAEGYGTTASAEKAHAEGEGTTASAEMAHAEGRDTLAAGRASHTSGYGTVATSQSEYVVGEYNVYDGAQYGVTVESSTIKINTTTLYYFADGYTFDESTGMFAFVNPIGPKVFTSDCIGKYFVRDLYDPSQMSSMEQIISATSTANTYNIKQYYRKTMKYSRGKYVHTVGNGTSDDARSNAHTLDWSGNAWFAGDVKIGGTGQDDASASKLATESYVDATAMPRKVLTGTDENPAVIVELGMGVYELPAGTTYSYYRNNDTYTTNGSFIIIYRADEYIVAGVEMSADWSYGVADIYLNVGDPDNAWNSFGTGYVSGYHGEDNFGRIMRVGMGGYVESGFDYVYCFNNDRSIPLVLSNLEEKCGAATYLKLEGCFKVYPEDENIVQLGEGQVTAIYDRENSTVRNVILFYNDKIVQYHIDLNTDEKYVKYEYVTKSYVEALIDLIKPKSTTVTIPAANWTGDANPWSQVVSINGVTENSKVDLQPTAQQIVALQDAEVSIMLQNDSGIITAWAIGKKPTVDYTFDVLITEVNVI